jgi:transcriptional regulator with XRE-family HTH domain
MPRRDALEKKRRESGFTHESLAARLGVAPKTVARWEAGTAIPRPGMRLALAEALGISLVAVADLVDGASLSPEHSTPEPTASLQPEPPSLPDVAADLLRSKLTSRFHQIRQVPLSGESVDASPLTLNGGALAGSSPDFGQHELDALLLSPLSQWAALDNRLGPQRLRGIVSAHFGVIDSCLDEARGSDFNRSNDPALDPEDEDAAPAGDGVEPAR